MLILGIDPGPERSAYVLYGPTTRSIWQHGWLSNTTCEDYGQLRILHDSYGYNGIQLVIERIQSYMMRVGQEVFDTQWEARGIYDAWPGCKSWLRRTDVKLRLCGRTAANDADVRAALIDFFGPGKDKAVGNKKTPGPLYGLTRDFWSALAVAVAFEIGAPSN